MQRLEQGLAKHSRRIARIPILLCAALMADGCKESGTSSSPASVAPPPVLEKVRTYADRANAAIQETVDCLAGTGRFREVKCADLSISFTGESLLEGTKQAVSAAAEAAQHTAKPGGTVRCMEALLEAPSMAKRKGKQKPRHLKTPYGATVKDMELILWSEPSAFPDSSSIGCNLLTKTVKSIGAGRYNVSQLNWPCFIFQRFSKPEKLRRRVRKIVADSFANGSFDFPDSLCGPPEAEPDAGL